MGLKELGAENSVKDSLQILIGFVVRGVIKQEKVVFSTPSHVTYGLYIFEKNQTMYISNSLYLLMVYNGLEMDSEYAGYEVDLNSIRKGVNKYTQKI